MPCSVDNLNEYNQKRVQLYTAIKEYNSAGYSKRQISKVLHCSRNTVTKYLNGEYEALCKKDFRSGMDQFYDYIVKALTSGISRKDVYRNVIEKGYKGGQSAAYDYMNKIIERFQIDVAIYKSSSPEALQNKRPYKNMTTFHETVYSVIFGWGWNLAKTIRHIFYRNIPNSES